MTTDEAAEIVWRYLNISSPPQKADALIVLGSDDIRIADFASKLFLEGYAPRMVMSGAFNKYTKNIFPDTEAESFARRAVKKSVPVEKILIEKQSTNTQENLEYSLKMLQGETFLLIQKPNMLRRVLATAQKLFPEKSFSVCSHPIAFVEGPHPHLPKEYFYHEIAGDLQRIMLYGEKGLIVSQEIPQDVKEAWKLLIEKGYTGNLV